MEEPRPGRTNDPGARWHPDLSGQPTGPETEGAEQDAYEEGGSLDEPDADTVPGYLTLELDLNALANDVRAPDIPPAGEGGAPPGMTPEGLPRTTREAEATAAWSEVTPSLELPDLGQEDMDTVPGYLTLELDLSLLPSDFEAEAPTDVEAPVSLEAPEVARPTLQPPPEISFDALEWTDEEPSTIPGHLTLELDLSTIENQLRNISEDETESTT